ARRPGWRCWRSARKSPRALGGARGLAWAGADRDRWSRGGPAGLPFGEAAVGVAPERAAPAVSHRGALAHVVFIDFDAPAGTLRDGHHAVLVGERLAVADVVEQVVVGVVVDAQALFLDEGVVAAGVDLQAGRQRDRAERAVQRQGDVVGLGHGGDLAGLGDAAGVRRIGLDDVHIALGQ